MGVKKARDADHFAGSTVDVVNVGLHPLCVHDAGHADISKRDSALYMQIAATGKRM
jgi:hypothetical protein